MENLNKIYCENRDEWRNWLSENFDTAKDVWLISPKSKSDNPCVSYNDSVEEALCFGWIDSVKKTLDEYNTIQRFSPRKPKSSYSQTNIERLKYLAQQNLLHPKIENITKDLINAEFIFADDIIKRLKSDGKVWDIYRDFPESYKRVRVAHIENARKLPEEFEKRLEKFIDKTRQNKFITGFAGIEDFSK